MEESVDETIVDENWGEVLRGLGNNKNYAHVFSETEGVSGKTDISLALIEAARRNGDKTLVFCSSIAFLDVMQHLLHKNGFSEVAVARLQGDMSSIAKSKAIKKFQGDRRCCVFLLSTMAANVGINLTKATRVILVDTSWNPATDLQAIFRSYRYGQAKPVFVYRLVASGTIEHKIFRRSLNKRALAQGVGDDDHQSRQFSTDEVEKLLDPSGLVVAAQSPSLAEAEAPSGEVWAASGGSSGGASDGGASNFGGATDGSPSGGSAVAATAASADAAAVSATAVTHAEVGEKPGDEETDGRSAK